MTSKDAVSDPAPALNVVQLVGRVSAAPETRELPSGAALVTFRLIVPRPAGQSGASTDRTRVDVLDIACWSARTRRPAARLEPDVVVRVEGALRRRFFRAGGATASRYEVEAGSVARVRSSLERLPRSAGRIG